MMVRKFIIASTLLVLLGAVLAGSWLWILARTLPDAEQLARYKPPITSRVHAGDGKLVAEFARQHRAYVPIAELPQELVDAFISAEDKNFFEHFGLDPMGIFRAILRTIGNKVSGKGGLQGGSTITQQVAKNMLLSNEQTLMRKIKEAMVALRIEKIFGKSQILELYMNEIYLGGRSYGVGAASLNYFNKPLSELTLAECALLAALPKAPGSVNPYLRPAAAQARRNWVIGRMQANGYIDQEDAMVAIAEPLTTVSRLKGEDIKASRYFVEEVRREVLKLYDTPEQGKRALYEGGLSIRSTLDTHLQVVARRVLWAGLETYDRRRGWRGPVSQLAIEGVTDWAGIMAKAKRPEGAGERGWRKAVVLEVSDERVRLGLVDGTQFVLHDKDRQWVKSSIGQWRKRAAHQRRRWEEEQVKIAKERAEARDQAQIRARNEAWAQIEIWAQMEGYASAEDERSVEARAKMVPLSPVQTVADSGLPDLITLELLAPDAADSVSLVSEAVPMLAPDSGQASVPLSGEAGAISPYAPESMAGTEETPVEPPDFEAIIPPSLQVGQMVLVSREIPHNLNKHPLSGALSELTLAASAGDQPWRLQQLPRVEGALVAMDPHTGRILALTGGYSFDRSQFNRAVQAKRQPGSSFKPFVYAAALDKGFTPVSKILDAPFVIDTRQGLYKPSNYSDRFYGLSTLRLGIEKSRNLMTVRLAQEVGIETISDYGRRFGLYENSMAFLSAALGAGETTPIKIAAAYSMLVNGGKRVLPTLLDRTQNRDGRTVFRRDSRQCQTCNTGWNGQAPPSLPDTRDKVLDPITAYQIVSMLEGVIHRGTARTVQAVGKPVAGKTGTTNDYIDAWFVGFSPDLVACVWVGFDSPDSLGDGESGGRIAAPIFRDFMKIALAEAPGAPFRIPPGVRLVEIDVATGNLARPSTRERILEAFRPGSEPSAQNRKSRNVSDDDDWISLMRQGTDYTLPSAGGAGRKTPAPLPRTPPAPSGKTAPPPELVPAPIPEDPSSTGVGETGAGAALSLDEGVY